MKLKTRVVSAAILAVVGLIAAVAPMLLELRTIQTVRDQYYLDAAVHNEVMDKSQYKPPSQKLTADEFLNPAYLKKYDLSNG